MKLTTLSLIMFLLLGCNNNSGTSSGTDSARNSVIANEINWVVTDSLEYIYYPNPADQKQYKHQFIKERAIVQSLIRNFSDSITTTGKACAHKSKFYLFKGGDVFKTIYVSDSCNYLAYAINSNQRFVSINDTTRRIIDSLNFILKK